MKNDDGKFIFKKFYEEECRFTKRTWDKDKSKKLKVVKSFHSSFEVLTNLMLRKILKIFTNI
jgi:hypothetical protein